MTCVILYIYKTIRSNGWLDRKSSSKSLCDLLFLFYIYIYWNSSVFFNL